MSKEGRSHRRPRQTESGIDGRSERVQIHGEDVKIDRYIAPVIELAQQKGMETASSCSGLRSEHRGRGSGYVHHFGYISFRTREWSEARRIKKMLEDSGFLEVEIFQPHTYPFAGLLITGYLAAAYSDDRKKQAWKNLHRAMQTW